VTRRFVREGDAPILQQHGVFGQAVEEKGPVGEADLAQGGTLPQGLSNCLEGSWCSLKPPYYPSCLHRRLGQ
jgi:hypothetical protein